MRDRLPKHPGRVQLTPVDGQAGLYDMVRKDGTVEPGTPLNKATLLPDDVCDALGLDRATATPGGGIMAAYGRIGEVKISARTCIGDNWALCNGDGILARVYPECATILKETVGDVWRQIELQLSMTIQRIRHLNGKFFAVGCDKNASGEQGATVAYADTLDGIWTVAISSQRGCLYDIAYGNGQYIACGLAKYNNNGGFSLLMYSDDLVSWGTRQASGANDDVTLTSIGFINGNFFSSGVNFYGGSGLNLFSGSMASSMKSIPYFDGRYSQGTSNVLFAQGKYVVFLKENAYIYAYTSLDGISWTRGTIQQYEDTNIETFSAYFIDNLYVLLSSAKNYIRYTASVSANGFSTARLPEADCRLVDMAYVNGLFVIYANANTYPAIYYSTALDGILERRQINDMQMAELHGGFVDTGDELVLSGRSPKGKSFAFVSASERSIRLPTMPVVDAYAYIRIE